LDIRVKYSKEIESRKYSKKCILVVLPPGFDDAILLQPFPGGDLGKYNVLF